MSEVVREIESRYRRDMREVERMALRSIVTHAMAWSSGFVAGLLVAWYALL